MKHKPSCSSHTISTVYRHDGIYPHGKCDCGLDAPAPTENRESVPQPLNPYDVRVEPVTSSSESVEKIVNEFWTKFDDGKTPQMVAMMDWLRTTMTLIIGRR